MSILRNMLVDTSDHQTNTDAVSMEAISCGSEMLEVSEQYNEIVSMEDAVERLEEIHESLESLLVISEDSLEEGGLTVTTSNILRISTEALVAPLGLSSPILSAESFGGEGERLTSTRVSIEEEKGTIEKVWNAIKRSITALRKKVSDWYNGVWKNVDSMLDKNNKLKEAINGLTDQVDETKTIKFSLGSLVSKDQDIGDVLGNLGNLEASLNEFTKAGVITNPVKSIMDKFKSIDPKILKDEDAVSKFVKDIETDMKGYAGLSSSTKDTGTVKSMESDGTTVVKHKEFPGNKALFSIYGDTDFRKTTWKLGPNVDGGDRSGSSDLEVLNKADLLSIQSTVDTILTGIKIFKSEADNIKKVKADMDKMGEDFAIAAAGSGNENLAGTMVNYLRVFEKMLDNPINQLTAHGVKSSGAAMSLAANMVKAY